MTLLCQRCDALFSAASGAARYCSVECRLKARHERAIRRLDALQPTETVVSLNGIVADPDATARKVQQILKNFKDCQNDN